MNKKEYGMDPEKKGAKRKIDWKAPEIVHPDAAGIDIGGSEHWVAVSPERDEQPVRGFECYTADLEQMADWLVERGVRSVAIAYASHCTSLGRCDTFSACKGRFDNLTPLALRGGVGTGIFVKVLVFVIAQMRAQKSGITPDFDLRSANIQPRRYLL